MINEKEKLTPFEKALSGDFDAVKKTVEYSMASMNQYDENNRSLLHYAAMSGNAQMCKYLVERVGLSIKAPDKDLVTPYELAFKMHGTESEVYRYFKEIMECDYENMYHNPIRRGFYPDPSICRVDNDYYMVNSSFVYFPAIPISHSTDLINWDIIGFAITDPSWARLDELDGGRGYWAADISFDNGYFYVTATYRMNDGQDKVRFQMVTRSKNPEGPYEEPVFIDEDGIDPAIFHEDGRHYMLLNRGGRMFELSSDCKEKVSEPKLLWYGDFKRAPEGPHLYKKDGYYYLIMAEGGTGEGHRVTVARSKTIDGVYESCPYNPIMRQWIPTEPIQNCGHGDLVTTPDGKWYMVYLGVRKYQGEYNFIGRETFLDPVEWTADGWPIVNNLKGPGAINPLPHNKALTKSLDVYLKEIIKEASEDDFVSSLFKAGFMTIRSMEKDSFGINERKHLLLKSGKIALSSNKARNLLLLRQSSFVFHFESVFNNIDIKEEEQVGITCYYDENTFACLYLTRENDKIKICVCEHVGNEDRVYSEIYEHELSECRFSVDTNGLVRRFSANDFFYELGNAYYLSDNGVKIGKRFTGATVGVFAYSRVRDFYAEIVDIIYRNM